VICIAGYRMPHPLVNDCHVKVQTMNHRTTPIKVFQAALQDLTDEVGCIERSFNVCEMVVVLGNISANWFMSDIIKAVRPICWNINGIQDVVFGIV
jgi:hypothetical protein